MQKHEVHDDYKLQLLEILRHTIENFVVILNYEPFETEIILELR